MDVTRNNRQLLSKIATNEGHGENSPYFHGLKAYSEDPFHPSENPDGVIQMGLAENQLSFDLIEDWIKANPTTSICTREGVHKFRDIANFQDYHGLPEFRNGLAKFMGRVRGGRVTFDPDRIVMAGGATGANEMIIFCLADPGDAFLLPSPYYASFERDLGWRTGVQLVPVHCNSSNNFKITRAALEQALARARHKNINVKGLIITNPWNPLGTTLDPSTVKTILRFTNHHNIHLVADEIYSATVFASPAFVSVAQIIQDTDVPVDGNLVHLVYSLSKDMGFPGFRVGVLYSYNDAVVSCARKMSSFGLVSSQTQHLIAAMLSDEVFVGKFVAESARRLRKSHGVFTEGLREVSIGWLEGNAGLFCWVDLRRLLREETFEGEMELWKVIVNEVKLNVSPGSSFHCAEPGWFRICFANMDDHTLRLALERIKTFVGDRG